ncbi:uncharacterized protein LOC127786265 [Oryza glaberrima]|uniref:uncharacterized protein LOC127786265 n=1 Tax=Oryza glaberrima TaxID=4538 RepID=UPI00224C1828|nr:uncharacterized protein LOC127786265 [Oryza glaberrima]
MDNPEIEHAASTPRGGIPSTPPGAKIAAIAIADEQPPAPARSDRVTEGTMPCMSNVPVGEAMASCNRSGSTRQAASPTPTPCNPPPPRQAASELACGAEPPRVLGKRARKDIAEGCSPSPTATRAMRAGVDDSMEMHTGEFASDGVDDPQQCTPRRTPHGRTGTPARLYAPGRVTAMEQSMREYAIARRGYVFDPRQGIEFDLLSEAYDFYNLYSFECGFGIRRGKSYTNTKQFRNWQQLVCGRAVRACLKHTQLYF